MLHLLFDSAFQFFRPIDLPFRIEFHIFDAMLMSMFDRSMNKAHSPVIAFESFTDLTN